MASGRSWEISGDTICSNHSRRGGENWSWSGFALRQQDFTDGLEVVENEKNDTNGFGLNNWQETGAITAVGNTTVRTDLGGDGRGARNQEFT